MYLALDVPINSNHPLTLRRSSSPSRTLRPSISISISLDCPAGAGGNHKRGTGQGPRVANAVNGVGVSRPAGIPRGFRYPRALKGVGGGNRRLAEPGSAAPGDGDGDWAIGYRRASGLLACCGASLPRVMPSGLRQVLASPREFLQPSLTHCEERVRSGAPIDGTAMFPYACTPLADPRR